MKRLICGESVKGATHERNGLPLQDSKRIEEVSDHITILSVADGHGSDKCPRSDRGSLMAVNAFCDVMKKYLHGYGQTQEGMAELVTVLNREGDTRFAQDVCDEWQVRVKQSFYKNKDSSLIEADGHINWDGVYSLYGTTLLGMLITDIPVKGRMTQEVFNRIFEAMTRDNPLIYYLNQSTCSLATDVLGHTAICPQYFFSRERIHEYNRKIEKAVNELAADLKLKEGTEYEKELKVHDWLCNFVSYDYDGADINDPVRFMEAHNIVGVFAHHRAQCEGIAKAVKVLLNAVDIKCIVVTGKADGNGQNGPHAWNIVNIDGKAYQLDITWDIGAGGKNKDRMAYDYFNLTDGMMYMDHYLVILEKNTNQM